MIKNKTKKVVVSLILTIIMLLTFTQSVIYAADSTLTTQLSYTRFVKNSSGGYDEKRAYAIHNGSDHPIFQIISVNGSGNKTGTNFYCLNAGVGSTWTSSTVGTSVDYDKSYDLVSQKSDIQALTADAYKGVATNTYYPQIMWILDHMYVEGGTSVTNLLKEAGIEKGDLGQLTPITAYHYNPEKNPNSAFSDESGNLYRSLKGIDDGYYYRNSGGDIVDVVLTKEMVEVVQQAAIWYFTNYKPQVGTNYAHYNNYTNKTESSPKDWLKVADKTNPTNLTLLSNEKTTDGSGNQIETGAMLQEQADILYNYLIDKANAAAASGYTGTTAGTLGLDYTTSTKIVEDGDNYKIGPMKISTTGNMTSLALKVTTGTSDTDITSQATVTGTNKTSPEANKEFYVSVPKTSANGAIKITVTGTSTATTKKLWIKNVANSANVEQPIVEVEKTNEPKSASLTATPTKQFDLALRKIITKVDGVSTLKNENGLNAKRTKEDGTLNIDKSTIPETATYKHRKDPVVVRQGSKVTYEIRLYNEGEIDGYATKVVDQLPEGLTSTLKTGDKVTSKNNQNVYTVNYDSTTNKIELTMTTKKAVLAAYNGTTLAEDVIELEATVNQAPATDGATKHYLTNIAYIAEEYDKDNNKITADRDGNESKPTESPSQTASQLNSTDANNYKGKSDNKSVYSDTNNSEYYKGEQDDDDFEKVVVLPKKFDLALRKFITKINQEDITDRVPVISDAEKEKLAENNATYDKGTTLEKTHPKDKKKVKKGDTVVYTIRVYNEGEIDGFASKVTDYLPAGLTFKKYTAGDGSINDVNGWTANGQEITTTKLATEKINAFNKTTKVLDYKDLQVECTVNENATSSNLKNIAEITECKDEKGDKVTDIDSQPGNVEKDTSKYNPTNPDKGRGEQDDDDFEDLDLKEFDLALRKFISSVSKNGDFSKATTYNRVPQVDTSKLKAGTAKTAIYNHSKEPIHLDVGDFVLYTIRVYNEGELDGYASEITDYLPENLDFVNSSDSYIKSVNDKWEYDAKTRKVTTKSDNKNATTLLKAFDSNKDNKKGSGLSYVDVQIICKVNNNTPANKKLTNIAEISEYKDEDKKVVNPDRDSTSDDLDYPENPETYKDDEIDKDYVPGQEDDDDFEKVIVKERKVDLALTKFITAVSKDTKIEDGEYLTPNKKIGSKTNEYTRATVADTTGLKAGTSTNATYTPKKDIEPLAVAKNSYILYNIRVYNEGEVDVFAGEVTDYLPENLEFVNGEFNKQYGWTANGQTVKTTYLSSSNGADKILKAFDKENDNGKGSGLDYKDLPVLCKVSDKAESGKKLVNTAEITKYEDEDGKELPKDIDSTPENKEEKNVEERDEDDDDYEVVIIKEFDLALRKFITNIEGKDITTRIPKVSYKNNKITYTHPKDVIKLHVKDTVTYTLRVFNEGDIAGFAQEIADDIPEHLEFLPNNSINKQYRWKMYDKNGKETTNIKNAVRIKTDYTSKENGESLMKSKSLKENPNLLNAFDKTAKISNTNPDYVDVKVAFKVKNPNSNKTVITNKAQITEDADEHGDPVEDIDSIPDKWNEGEDDQDYENVGVEYFDLSLLKYVTKAIVTENGKTKTTKTGNNGSDKDIMPKVEIHRKHINKTVVKFEYTIKITNEGDIEGYATEITDYVPKGLKFYSEDNKGWKDEGNNVISTTLLKNTLLKPGQSATVKVVLRWINGENNLSMKTNTAEISKDKNDKGVPDRDSTPDNKKLGEDDIDDAPVILTIKTGGFENTIAYIGGALAILVVLGLGIVAIKRYV